MFAHDENIENNNGSNNTSNTNDRVGAITAFMQIREKKTTKEVRRAWHETKRGWLKAPRHLRHPRGESEGGKYAWDVQHLVRAEDALER